MPQMTGRELKGLRVCLVCEHLYVETDDLSKKICTCERPDLAPAELLHTMSFREIKRRSRGGGKQALNELQARRN